MNATSFYFFLFLLLICFSLSSGLLIKGKYVQIQVGDTQFNVKAFGAIGDGKTDDTKAFQKAIDAASKNGGTVVIQGPNKYLIKAITVTGNNVQLFLSKKPTVLISNDRSRWPSGKEIITAENVKNFAITGDGTFDGQGAIWWENRNDFRPRFVYAHHVKGMIISGVTFKDSPNHFLQCFSDNTEIHGVTLLSPPSTGIPKPSHNTDGVDVHGEPFYIWNSTISVGDDNVACHANNTLVEDCFFGTGHGASIGSLADDWLRNITFRRIQFVGTTCGARIKTIQGTAGELSDVYFEDLTLRNVKQTIEIDMKYLPSSKKTSWKIHDIHYRNIKAYNAQIAGEINCLADSPCKNIEMTNVVHLNTPTKSGFSCAFVSGTSKTVSPKTCIN